MVLDQRSQSIYDLSLHNADSGPNSTNRSLSFQETRVPTTLASICGPPLACITHRPPSLSETRIVTIFTSVYNTDTAFYPFGVCVKEGQRLGLKLLYLNKLTFFKCYILLAAELESSLIARKIVGVASRSRRINQSHCSIPGIVIGWFFCFSVCRLRFRRAYGSTYDSDFRFSLGRKPS